MSQHSRSLAGSVILPSLCDADRLMIPSIVGPEPDAAMPNQMAAAIPRAIAQRPSSLRLLIRAPVFETRVSLNRYSKEVNPPV
jgi:hypothetical protein